MIYFGLMNFLPNERRTRHLYIENSIQNYLEVLDKNDASNGCVHPSVSKKYREMIENFTIPNNRHGVLRLGKAALNSENFIPIWACRPGEDFSLDPSLLALTPVQKHITKKVLAEYGFTNSGYNTEESYFNEQCSFSVELPEGAAVVTEEHYLPLDIDDTCGLLISRPTLVLNMKNENNRTMQLESPAAIHHELTHVSQSLDSPIEILRTNGEYDDLLIVDELEAYLHFGYIIQEQGRQNYTVKNGEQPFTYKPYSLAMEAREIMQKFGHPSLPFYKVDRRSKVIQHIRQEKLLSIITHGLDQSEERRNSLLSVVDNLE